MGQPKRAAPVLLHSPSSQKQLVVALSSLGRTLEPGRRESPCLARRHTQAGWGLNPAIGLRR